MFLGKIAERHYNHRGEHLGVGSVYIEDFNKKLEENIVQENAGQYQYKVPEQLHPPAKNGAGKNNKPVEEITRGKRHHKGYEKRGNVRADGSGWCVHHLEMVTYQVFKSRSINNDIQYGVPSAARRIPECLYGHQLPERNIKKVDNC